MRIYAWSFIIAALVSFLIGSSLYLTFGYDSSVNVFENLIQIYQLQGFWIGVAIWTLLYALFLSLPITFLTHRVSKQEKKI